MKIPSLLAGLLFFQAICFSATIYVPDDHATIQDAIDGAVNGDTVIVRPGTYVERIDFLGKVITVKSEQGPEVTVIDGNGSGSVVTFQSGESLTSILDSFTIRNGTGTFYPTQSWYEGGGIYLLNSSATIRGCTIRDNASDHGGGVGARNAIPEITDCMFLNNTAVEGGGGMCLYDYSDGEIAATTFQGNTCHGSWDGGGGIYCENSSPVIDACTFTENDASGGGAIRLNWYSNAMITGCSIVGNSAGGSAGIGCQYSSPVISGCEINNNVATGQGGGVDMCNDSWPRIIGNTISGNIAETGGGGGIYCLSPPQEITNNLIENNSAGEDGGGIYWSCKSFSPVTISGNTIRGNSVPTHDKGYGGGICIHETFGYNLTLENNTIEENQAYKGGGIYCFDGDVLMVRNSIFGNRAFQGGGGIYIWLCSPELTNCVIAHNRAEEGGGIFCELNAAFLNCTIAYNWAYEGAGLYCDAWYGYPTFINSIFWNNPIPPGGEIFVAYNDPVITYSNVRGGWPGIGNIDSDPLFVSHETRDYHLTHDSPCREAGDSSASGLPSADFEGDPRIAGTMVDMGCDEFHEHLYYIGSVIPGSWGKIKVVGTPGAAPVELALGSGKLDPPRGTPFGDLCLQFPLEARLAMPAVGSNGISELPVKIPDCWLFGEKHYLQALIGPLAPGSRLTNLLVLDVE